MSRMIGGIAHRRCWPALCGLVLCLAFAVAPAAVSAATSSAVSAQSPQFEVDVWTSKGGQGLGAAGGSFGPNEELVVYIWASHDCYASITIGPSGGEPGTFFDAELEGGVTVSLVPSEAGTDLAGTWEVTVSAASKDGGALSSDYVVFSIGATTPTPATPPPAPAPPTSTPASAPLAQDNATTLDALIALKMAEGSLPAEAQYDVNGDGRVTVDDARAILKWAVQ